MLLSSTERQTLCHLHKLEVLPEVDFGSICSVTSVKTTCSTFYTSYNNTHSHQWRRTESRFYMLAAVFNTAHKWQATGFGGVVQVKLLTGLPVHWDTVFSCVLTCCENHSKTTLQHKLRHCQWSKVGKILYFFKSKVFKQMYQYQKVIIFS